MHDIVIIGAGPAGMTAAIYAARAGKSVLLLEAESYGGQITYSPRVENYPGVKQISGNALAAQLVDQTLDLGVETELTAVTGLEPVPDGFTVHSGEGDFSAKSVVIATGVKHRRLGLPGEEELAGISYCAVCDGAFYKDQDVAVVGGGDTALQDALFLAGLCRSVTVVHRRQMFRGERRLLDSLREKTNVAFRLDCVVDVLKGDAELTGLMLRNVVTGERERLSAAGLFVAVGQIPGNEAFAGSLALDESGYILADEDCRTSLPGVFAAGDCRRKSVRQLTTAVGDGAVAALAACRFAETGE